MFLLRLSSSFTEIVSLCMQCVNELCLLSSLLPHNASWNEGAGSSPQMIRIANCQLLRLCYASISRSSKIWILGSSPQRFCNNVSLFVPKFATLFSGLDPQHWLMSGSQFVSLDPQMTPLGRFLMFCFFLSLLHNRPHIGCQSLSPIFTLSWFV